MTNEEFTKQIRANWIDSNGLVKAQPEWITSGNGLFYASIAEFLSDQIVVDSKSFFDCWYKLGCLKRNPQNTFGQEQFDDYLGFATLCIAFNLTQNARIICWYAVRHGYFMLNVPFTWSDFFKSFLLRFPQVWVLMWCAAYPWLKWPLYPFMKLIALFMKLDPTDPGGVQLSWLYFEGMNSLGFHTKQLDKARSMIPAAFKQYYHKDHPFIQFVTEKYILTN